MSEKTSVLKQKRSGNYVHYIVKIAILAAISTVIMLFEFPLWFAPGFYKLDLSECVVLIGAFAMGPMAGVYIEAIKILLNLCINFTTTAGIGELANFILGCAFVIPAALIYKHRKSFKTALVGIVVGTVSLAVFGALLNIYMLIPAYSLFYGMPLEAIVAAGTAVNGAITNVYTLVLFAVVPFNLLKGAACGLITMLLYKRLSPILHK